MKRFEGGEILARDDVGVVHAEEIADGAEQAGLALLEHVGGLGGLEARVQRDEHGAGGLQAEGRDDPARAVRRPDPDAVAALDARGHEGARAFSTAASRAPRR